MLSFSNCDLTQLPPDSLRSRVKLTLDAHRYPSWMELTTGPR